MSGGKVKVKGYTAYKVFKKLKESKFLYSFMILQLFVGFYILNVFLTATVSYQKTYESMVNSGIKKKYYLNFELVDRDLYNHEQFDLITWGKMEAVFYENENFPFSGNDLKELEQLSGAELNSEVNIPLHYLQGEEMQENTIYYKSNIDKVYITKGFLSIIDKISNETTVNPRDFPYEFENNKLFNEVNGSFEEVELIEDDESYIWIPMEWYYPIFHYKDLNNISLILTFGKEHKFTELELMEKMYEIKELLEGKNTEYTISIDNQFYNFIQQANDMKESSIIFNLIGSALIVIITLGMLGIFILFMEQRKKEIAICIALGGTKIQIAFEVIIEIMIITYIGFALANIASAVTLMNGFENATMTIYYNPAVSLMLVGLPFIIGLVASLPSVYMIKKLLPLEILRCL